MTVVVSIGRNVGAVPMDEDRWATFQLEAHETVAQYGTVVFAGEGDGIYQGEIEQAFTLVATIGAPIAGLYRALESLARRYDQDSIALTTGHTSFPGGE